jgi:hypothetical protein
METSKNTIHVEATENAKHLANTLFTKSADVTVSAIKGIEFAWTNEKLIASESLRLQRITSEIRERMHDVDLSLEIGCVDRLNTCGILQGLNSDLDRTVAILKTSISNRGFYSNLLVR